MKRPLALCATLILLGIAGIGILGAAGPAGRAPGAFPAPAGQASWSDFTLKRIDGRPVSLKPLLGKNPVLLVFWATWCPYCNADIPKIKALHAVSSDRVEILALDFKESREKVSAFVRAKEIPYTVLLDPQGKVARRYGIVGVPTYILITREGRVAYTGNEFPKNLREYLR